MSFTARHYNEVARIIRTENERIEDSRGKVNPDYVTGAKVTIMTLQESIRRMFCADNPRFDGARFDQNCEPRR